MANIIVNASTSLVNINTSNIPLTSSAVVLLSSVNAPGAIITIRDYAGLASTNRKIIISTTSDTQFLDGPQISSFEIVTPYGFFTVSPRDSSVWTVLNSFAFGSQANASVSSLVVTGQITADRILNASTFSTSHVQTSSITIGTRGIRTTPEGYDVLSTMVFTSSGNVGIYTSTPAATLHIIGNEYIQQPSTIRFALGRGGSGNSNIRYSYDGINWSNIASGDFGVQGYNIAYNGSNRWVAVGYTSPTTGNIKYSSDGINWSNGINTTNFNEVYSVAWNGNKFIFLDGTWVGQSTDGITWSYLSDLNTIGLKIAWNGQYWLAGGYSNITTRTNTIQRSFDGVTWAGNASGGFDGGCSSLDWNGSYWVAVGSDTNAANRIQYSTDGLNWSNATSGYNFTSGSAVKWNGSIWLAGGYASSSNDTLRYSTDGRVWLSSISAFDQGVLGIDWDGTQWIITGYRTSGSNIQYSRTGTGSWSNAGTLGSFSSNGWNISVTKAPSLTVKNLELHTQNIPSYTTSTNKLFATPSSLIINDVLTVQNTGVNASNVGINTKNPSYTLDVNGSINFSTIFVNGTSAQLINSSTFNVSSLTVSTIQPQTAGRTITIPTTVQASTLLASTMGIGTASPDSILQIVGSSINYSANEFNRHSFVVGTGQATGAQQLIFGNFSTSTGLSSYSYIQSVSYNVNTNPLYLNARGGNIILGVAGCNVGINTSTPRTILDIMQPSGTGALSIQNNSVSGNVAIDFYTHLSSYVGSIGYGNTGSSSGSVFQDKMWIYHNAKDFVFIGSGTAERMRVTSAGRVGIGNTNPLTKLHVSANAANVSSCIVARNSDVDVCFGFNNSGGNYGAIQVFSGGSGSAFGTTPYILEIQPFGGEVRMASNLLFISSTRIGIGTTSPSNALHVIQASGTASMALQNNSVSASPGYQLTLTGTMGMNNGTEIVAKNSAGTYETCLVPRFTDNWTYLQYGANGLIVRNNSMTTAMTIDNNRVVSVNNYLKYPNSIVGTALKSESAFTWAANTTVNKNEIIYTPKQSGTVTIYLYGTAESYLQGGSGNDAIILQIKQGTTTVLNQLYMQYVGDYLTTSGRAAIGQNSLGVSTTITGTTTFYLGLALNSDDSGGCVRSILYIHELAN